MIALELGSSPGGGVTGSAPISVYLVDDVEELRELVRLGLDEDPDFEVAGEAGDGRSGIDGIAATNPDAVLLDLSMPDMDGLQVIDRVREQHRDLAVIVLSGFSADRMGDIVLRRGADAYVEKGTPIQDIRDAVRVAVATRRRV